MEVIMVSITAIFGIGNELNILQMSSRAVIVFIFTLLLIRVAGRRSFGLRAPIDNILLILLGAILSRAVVGASPFFPTLAAGLVISVLHRILALLAVISPAVGKVIKGSKILLYQDGSIKAPHLRRSLVSREDIMEELRLRTHEDNLAQFDMIYMERSGQISAVKKANESS